jgi:hypothetical protein
LEQSKLNQSLEKKKFSESKLFFYRFQVHLGDGFQKYFWFPNRPPCSGTAEGHFLVIWEKWFYEKGHNFSFAWSI